MTTQLFKFAALAQAAIALIFILIALTAGNKPDYLENVHIIRFNMSEIGQNLVPAPSAQNNPVPSGKDCGGGILGKICDGAGDAVDKVQEVAGDAVDKVAEFAKDKLNIKDYYSIHLTDLCLGDFDGDGDPVIDSCTKPFDKEDMNVLKKLTDQLKPAGIDLNKLGFVKELTDALDKIPTALSAAGYFFTAIAVLLALCIATTAGATFIASGLGNTLTLASVGLAGLTWLLVLIGVLIITVVAAKVSSVVNDKGKDIGINASVGGVLIFLVWTGLLLMTGVLGTLVLCVMKKDGPPPPVVEDGQMYATKEEGSDTSPAPSGEFNRQYNYGQQQEGGYEAGHHDHHEESDVGEGAEYYHQEPHAYSPEPRHQDQFSPQQPYDNRYSVGPEQAQQYNRYSVGPNGRKLTG